MNTSARLSRIPAVVLAAIVCAGTAAAAEDKPVLYQCDDLGAVEADFRDERVQLALPDGSSLDLPQLPSGSGARYGNEAVEFWIKGDEAMMTRTEDGGEVEHDCRVSAASRTIVRMRSGNLA